MSAQVSRHRPVRRSTPEFFSRDPLLRDWEEWTTWLRDMLAIPASVEDDLVTVPSPMAIDLAINLLTHLMRNDAPPDVVTLGPNGEIVLERRLDDVAKQIVIYDDLRVDLIVYRNGRLEQRHLIAQPEVAIAW